jgi:hypothetical protein
MKGKKFFIRSDGLAELVGDRIIVFNPKPFFEKDGKEGSISHAESWQEVYDCLKKYGCEPDFKEKESQIPKIELDYFACFTLEQIFESYAFVTQIGDFLIAGYHWSEGEHALFFRYSEIWSVRLLLTHDVSEILKFVEAALPPFWEFDCEKFEKLKEILMTETKLTT